MHCHTTKSHRRYSTNTLQHFPISQPTGAGLLSTEAGTLGRFTGNAVLALVGHATGVERWAQLARFAAWLYGLLAAGCVALVPLIVLWYRHLR